MIEQAAVERAVSAEFAVALELPPFRTVLSRSYRGVVRDWLADAMARANAGSVVVCLVPARTDTRWWFDYCAEAEVRFLRGRVRFSGERTGAPFPSAIVVFRLPLEPRLAWWDVSRGELTYSEVFVGPRPGARAPKVEAIAGSRSDEPGASPDVEERSAVAGASS